MGIGVERGMVSCCTATKWRPQMLNVDIGKSLSFQFDDSQIVALSQHRNVLDHVWYIGLRNILMDSHASCKRDEFESEIQWRDASKAMAEKKLAAMMIGEIRANSSGPRASAKSPIESEALKLARVVVYAAAKAKGQTDKAIIAKSIADYAARPKTIATATANVAAKTALVADDDDLGL